MGVSETYKERTEKLWQNDTVDYGGGAVSGEDWKTAGNPPNQPLSYMILKLTLWERVTKIKIERMTINDILKTFTGTDSFKSLKCDIVIVDACGCTN